MTSPKSQLIGITLSSGWTLIEKLNSPAGATGSNFGVGYRASHNDGRTAFIKAIDFVDAINSADPLSELTKLVSIANFEKEVGEYCSTRGMTRVIEYIGHEYFSPDSNPLNRVSCLIMESGESDLRRIVNANGLSTCGWNLQVIRDVCQAIEQMHKGGIAHHDIKPSNVIAVKQSDKNMFMKVGDLGRVVRKDQLGPFDSFPWPGDTRYSPPERWYGFIPSGWTDAREAADAYMLGSLIIFLFTNATLQSLITPYIPNSFRPGFWTGGFDENLLPVLIDAHAKVINDSLLPQLMPEIADEMVAITLCLTHPDPRLRGDKRARNQIGKPVGIDRIRQKLSMMSLTCSAIERGINSR